MGLADITRDILKTFGQAIEDQVGLCKVLQETELHCSFWSVERKA